MAVKKAVAKKTAVKVVPATAVLVGRKAPGATKSVPRKPTKAKARVDAVEKKLDATFRKDEFGFGYLSFEESNELDKIEEENREALKSRPIQSGPSKTRQHAEMETLRRDIAALQVELTQTKADLADSLKKIEELTKPKENWFISMFRQEERAG